MKTLIALILFSTSALASAAPVTIRCESVPTDEPNFSRLTISQDAGGKYQIRSELVVKADGSRFWDFTKPVRSFEVNTNSLKIRTETTTDSDSSPTYQEIVAKASAPGKYTGVYALYIFDSDGDFRLPYWHKQWADDPVNCNVQ